jgi:hypothetical protein
MALDFGILQPANIAGNIMAGRQEAQRNQLAQQQLSMGGLQQQKAELELGDFRRRQAGLDSFIQKSRAAKKSGSEEDMLNSYEEYGLEVGDPQHIMNAQELRLAFNERKAYMGGGQPLPSIAAAPVAIPTTSQTATGASSIDEAMKLDYVKNAPAGVTYEDFAASQNAGVTKPVTANAPFVDARNLLAPGVALPPAAPVANQLAPAPAAAPAESVNQLGAPAARSPADIQARIIYLNQFPRVPAAKAEIAMLTKELEESRKLYTVGGNLVTGAGRSIFTAPEKVTPTDLRKNFEFAKTPEGGNYQGSFADFKAISTPKTTITMSTEKKYGEQFAGKLADRDDAKLGAAEKAPELAASANRIIDLVNQGNIFTGPVADIKLNIARGLNVLGASNDEKIANTELLIAATGKSTLDAISAANLGTGQGFTDKDLRFLQGIAGGKIDFKPETLTELARLQHLAATRSAEAWNKRAKQLPKSATEGTGLSTEAIKVPPLSSVTGTALRPAGVGPNWTFEKDAAGNKAWVSPDRKSFKEVN